MMAPPTLNGIRMIVVLSIVAATHHREVASALSISGLSQKQTSIHPVMVTSRHIPSPPPPKQHHALLGHTHPIDDAESTHDEQNFVDIDDDDDNAATMTVADDSHRRRRLILGSPSRRAFLAAPSSFLVAAAASSSSSSAAALLLPRAAYAATRDAKTGILLPSVGEIESSIPTTWDDDGDDNPITSMDASSFARLDSSPDTIFYSEPRFVEHVDERAVATMTSYISDGRLLKSGDSVLDLCSSWTSHIRPEVSSKLRRVAGLGMNAKELEANAALTEWTVMDLNDAKKKDATRLPYDDGSFDVILLQLSIDYLIHPLDVMREASRVLKRDGRIAILFSNRLFLSKAVGLWTGSDDIDHAYTVGSYLHFCGGEFTNIQAEDLSTRKQIGKERVIVGDPLYVVTATKS